MQLAKTLLYDIETAPNLAYVWGKWEQNAIAFERSWYILTFAYKWLDDKKVRAFSLPDFDGYKDDKTNDKALCAELWKLFNEADVVIGHNSDAFDNKKSYARFVQHKFAPPAPFQSVDTKKVAKRHFKFDSNKLDDLGDYLGVGRKMVHTGFDMWLGCIVRDDPKEWDRMVKYNKQDVLLLERVYHAMRPYMNNHPNANVYNETLANCPNCGGSRLIRNGWRPTRTGRYQRYQCTDCGAWSSASKNSSVIR